MKSTNKLTVATAKMTVWALLTILTGSLAQADTFTWTQDSAATQDWTIAGNWDGGTQFASGSGNALAFFLDTTTALTPGNNDITLNVPAALSLNTLTLNGKAAATADTTITLGTSASTWTIGDGTTSAIKINGVNNGSRKLNYIIPANLALNQTTTTVTGATGSGNLDLTGTITDATPGSGLDFNGQKNGAFTLSGDNTYTGKTTIRATLNGAASTLNVSSFNSVNGGTPLLASSSLGAPTTVANGTIQVGSTLRTSVTLRYTGGGETTDRVLNFSFNSSLSRFLNASGSGLLKFTSDLTGSGSGGASAPFVLTGSGTGEIAGVIPEFYSGIGLTKSGSGTWTLSGANAYTGGTRVSSGTLTVNGSLIDASGTIDGGTLNGSGALTFNINGAATDLITMTSGALTATGLTIAVNPTGAGLTASEYVLVNATGGTLTGPFAGLTGAPGYALNYDTPNQVKLVSLAGGVTYDDWKTANSTAGAIDEDHDEDGVQNGIEYFLGGATDTTGFSALPGVTNTGGTLGVTWTKAGDYEGNYESDFVVETSATLTGWVEETLAGGNITISGDDVIYTFPAGTKNFARLKVTGP